MMRWVSKRKADESGSILVLSVVGVVLAVISTALAVDLGRLAQDKRTDQKVADMAALDASRDLTQACARAKASVVRNNFPASTLNCVDPALNPSNDVVIGDYVDGAFTPSPLGNAVRVKVHTAFKTVFPFVTGPDGLDVKALASSTPWAGFILGSSLATMDSSRTTVLNGLVGRMIGGSSLNLSLVSWQGLASGSVMLQRLQTQLANAGFTVGSVDQLLSTQLTVGQFFKATADALTLNGDTANATVMDTLRVAATSTVKMSLGQILNVAQGAEGVALASSLNLFQLVTSTAEASAANGNSFIDLNIPSASINVAGTNSVSLRLKVISPPVHYIGPVGGSVSTGQVELTITPDLNLTLLGLIRVTNSLPLNITAAGATGTLKDVRCTGSKGITVTADPKAFSGPNASTTLEVKALASLVHLLGIQTTTSTPSVDGPAVDLTFSHPNEFAPPGTSKHAGSQPVGLQGLTNVTGTAVDVNAAGLLTVGLTSGEVVNSVLAALQTLIGNVDNAILTPLLTALGLDVGSADVTAPAEDFDATSCGQPKLIG